MSKRERAHPVAAVEVRTVFLFERLGQVRFYTPHEEDRERVSCLHIC